MRSWIIGSADDCDVRVLSSTVSGRHCCLLQLAQGYLIRDLRSTNGTFVNGRRVEETTFVSQVDAITLGLNEGMPWPSPTSPDKRSIHLGRDPENDVLLSDPSVSSFHARLVRHGEGFMIEDLGSSNGTFIDLAEPQIKQAVLTNKDKVYLGSIPLELEKMIGFFDDFPSVEVLLQHQSAAQSASDRKFLRLDGNETILGRALECDQVFDFPMISGRHARLVRNGKSVIVEDLGSSNGTYVNGKRIKGPTVIQPGDEIGLANLRFNFSGSGQFRVQDPRGALVLEATRISVDVPDRRLIEDISLTIHPTEFVGLMGPSGAGKTTLMSVLNGYLRPSQGSVFLNGKDLYLNYDQFQGDIGYVPQEDIIHRDLTVGQALYYTGRLRLPIDYPRAEIEARVSNVLKKLGLEGTEKVVVGSPERKGISGGQRKRVNLAMELLTEPRILFLDEPTSGLSSEDTLMVMKLLRQLADSGKTILLTIHQPSLEAFRLLDHLVVVSKDKGSQSPGKLAYFGPAYPDSVDFFNPNGLPHVRPGVEPSPDEVLRGLSKAPTEKWVEAYSQSIHQRRNVEERSGQFVPGRNKEATPPRTSDHLISQWKTLSKRCLDIKRQDKWQTAILLAQAPFIAFLITLVFGEQAGGPPGPVSAEAILKTIFVMVLAAIWFGCSNSAREIVGERAIYHRERMVNLRLLSYLASKFTVLGGLCLIQCFILLWIVYRGCSLQASFLVLLTGLSLASWTGLAVGLLISSISRTTEAAVALVPLVLLPMLILGGGLKPIHDLTGIVKPATAFVPSRWAFESLLLIESSSRPKFWEPMVRSELDVAHFAFPDDDENRTGVPLATIILLMMLASLVLANVGVLKFKERR